MKIKAFQLGQLVATPGALEELSPERILEILRRHMSGDWGLCGAEDWHLNDLATLEGSRIFSVYWIDESAPAKGRVWLISEGVNEDGIRASSCILLPGEY